MSDKYCAPRFHSKCDDTHLQDSMSDGDLPFQ